MYEAVTHQVKVTVEPTFDPERSDPEERRYFWRYAIEIVNLGDKSVTLMERRWQITDADGRQQEVRGPGVVGEQPTIPPSTRGPIVARIAALSPAAFGARRHSSPCAPR